MTDLFCIDLFCSILRDGPFVWPDLDEEAAGRLYDVARQHGVHLLLADRLWQRGALDDSPAAFRDRLAVSLRNQIAVEEIAQQELRGVLAALGDAGARPLLFKGAALAFTHYPDPVLRPRIDTDLLVDTSERHSASTTLERLGYRRLPLVTGELVMCQAPYEKTDAHGVRHVVDLHWKVSNPQVFARALRLEDLMACSVSVPQLGEAARAPSPAHGLALACVHRVAHHGDDERLLWTYDIHVLAERLTESEREDFVTFAAAQRLTAVCRRGLALAESRFHGRCARLLLKELTARRSMNPEPSERYVGRAMRKVDVLISDFQALEGWGPRLKLLREHLFPPPAYMREVYGVSRAAWLPLLYAWRVARGVGAWYRQPGRTRHEQG